MKIWYQSFTHPDEARPYQARLQAYLANAARPGATFTLAGMRALKRRG